MRFAKALGFPVVMAGGLFTLVFCFCCLRFNDPDMWWHLRLGKEIWDSHTIPMADTWSFTVAGSHWVPHEWLGEVLLYVAYLAGGYRGVALWFSGLSGCITIVSYFLCWRYSGNVAIAVAGGLITGFFGTIGYAPRPHLLGYLFLAVELLILHAAYAGKIRALWFLPPLFALWINCHASFFLGLGLFGVLQLCYTWKSRSLSGWIPLLACCAALFVNPVGVELVLHPVSLFLNQRTSLGFVTEWLPVTITDVRGLVMFGILGGLMILALLGKARAGIAELLVFVPVTYLAVQHTRMLFVFGIVAAPLVTRVLVDLRSWPPPKRDHMPSNAVLLVLCASACWAMFPSQNELQRRVASNFPVAAVDYMRANKLQGPILNDYVWGGFLVWHAPEYKVFIDGFGDVFEWNGVLQKYRRWAEVQTDPAQLLDEYKIQLCILPSDALEANVMPHLRGWKTAYKDSVSVVFTRTAAQTDNMLAQ